MKFCKKNLIGGIFVAYYIRLAEPRDLAAVLEIYAYARAFMAQNGNPNQWGSTNPPAETLRQDIEKQQMYLVVDGERICGVFALISGEDPTYRIIYDGRWSSGAPYHTIHRLAGNGSGGIFTACLSFCRENCGYLRIDTHHDNRVMQHCLEKAGFVRCGIIFLANGDPRIAYDLMN